MVCEELLQPAVRHRMSEQPFDCRKGACRHIGSRIEALDNMLRMTDRSGQHLRFVTIGAVDLHDVGYQCPPSSEMSSRRPRTGERDAPAFAASNACPTENTSVPVRPDIASVKIFYGPDSCGRAGQFHDDAGMQRRPAPHPLAPFLQSLWLPTSLTSADFNIMTVAVFRTPDVLFGHQRWVGRYAVQDAQFMRLADLFQIGRVDKKNF